MILQEEKQIIDIEKNKKSKLKDILNADIKDIKLFSRKDKKKSNDTKNKIEVVSFDVSEDFIRVVVGKFYKNELIISKCISEPTTINTVEDGKIINEQLLLEQIKNILSNYKIKAKYGSFTTNSTLIINREVIIPKVNEDEMDTVVSFEISKYLPINLNDYTLQSMILDELEEGGIERLKIHTICYPEKIARGYYDFLKKLNLRPLALDVKFNSLNKIIGYSQEINDEDYEIMDTNAFIDIGANFTEINIYTNNRLDFTRIIKLGYKNIGGHSLNNTNNYDVDYLIEEIERIFQFYKNKTRGNKIDRIYLLGEGSRIKDIDGYMYDRLKVKSDTINNIGFVEFKSKDNYENEMYKYLNAMGTIIRL